MAYDEALADRTRDAIGARRGVTEKKMFGGVAFLLDGKMFCGISNTDLMVRVGPDRYAESLTAPHVRPMDFTGRPMSGYIFVGASGTKSTDAVRKWVDLGAAFVATVPKKTGVQKPKPRR
jgi:TfoX/Sxy family transcriptional regulator of competence genes